MKFENFGKKLDKEAETLETDFNKMSKTTKYVVYGGLILLVLSLATCTMRGCNSTHYAAQPTYPAPVVQNSGMSAGEAIGIGLAGVAIGTMISDGRGGQIPYNGHNGQYETRYQHRPVTPTPVVPTNIVAPIVNKVAPGNATAELEKKKMEQERIAAETKRESRKASLLAQQKARVQSKQRGFGAFSKKASSSFGRKK